MAARRIPMPVNHIPEHGAVERRRRKIQVKGRGQPTAPQSTIALTCEADLAARTHRSRDVHRTYPLGGVENYDLLRGELVFGYPEPNYSTKAMQPNFSNRKVFTTFNGLQYGAEVQFLGTCKKEWIASQQRGDTAVTVCVSGTVTVNNTGDEFIHHMDLVYWDYPLVEYNESSRELSSRLQVWGVPADKFYPALRVLNLQGVQQTFREMSLEFRKHLLSLGYEAHGPPGGANNLKFNSVPAAQHADVMAFCDRLWSQYSYFRTEMPPGARGPGLMMMHMGHASQAEAKRRENNKDPVRRYLGYLMRAAGIPNDFWDPAMVDPALLAHDRALRDGDIRAQLSAQRHAKRFRPRGGHTAAYNRSMYLLEDGNLATPQEVADLKANNAAFQLYPEYITQCVCDQYNLLQQRVIGIATSEAPPGGKFDLVLGYYKR